MNNDELVTFFRPKPVIDVEDVIVVLIIITIIVNGLARLGENSSRIMRRFVFKCRVAYMIRIDDVCCQQSQWLLMRKFAHICMNMLSKPSKEICLQINTSQKNPHDDPQVVG